MLSEKARLKKIIDLGVEIAQYRDVDLLLERVLTAARQFVNAEAGSIYVREGDSLKFSYTQNALLQKRLPPGRKLIYSTFSVPINNASLAGYVAGNGAILNVPDVYRLTGSVPYSFDREYDRLSNYRTTSVLTLPLKAHQGNIIGVLQLINPKDKKDRVVRFSGRDEPFIAHFANTASIAIERAQMTRAIILRVIRMAELRDPKETGDHVNRVASYAVEIYEAWAKLRGVPVEQIEKDKDVLRMGAMLHDVGKVAIPDAILKKPSKLDPDEYETMKRHTVVGARLFADAYSDFDEAAQVIALNHHERWDGSGYPGHIDPVSERPVAGYAGENGRPRGKSQEEIPAFGRVVAIADVYDALCSRRSYKDPWDEQRALDAIREESGRHFDPEMVDAFFSGMDMIRNIAKRYPPEHPA